MKFVILALAIVASAPAIAAPPKPLTLAPHDAAEVLQLLGSSEVKGSDIPEVYRLMALLSQIAQSPPAQTESQPGEPLAEDKKSLIQREAEHAPKR